MNETPFIDEAGSEGDTFVVANSDTGRDDRWYPGKYTRRFLMAGIGAMATLIDNAGETFDQLADRGEQVSRELNDRVEDARRQNSGASDRVRDYARSGANTVLDTLGVPNKGDVDTINVKLNILSRKLDDLQMSHVTPSESPAGTISVPTDTSV
jgi:polyhydroxyalkanoate synthesis regulator phasin